MNGISIRLITRSLPVWLLLLCAAQVHATAPRFSAAKLAGEAVPHLLAYEFPPLVTGDAARPGAALEIVRQAFEAAGKPVPIEVSPSRSFAIQSLQNDAKAVGILAETRALSAGDRKGWSEVKILALTGKYYYHLPRRGESLGKVRDLNGLRGYTYGAAPGEATEALTKAGVKVVTDEPVSLWRRLKAGEVDFVSAFPPNAERLTAQLFPGGENEFAAMPMLAFESAYSAWFDKSRQPAADWHRTLAQGLEKLRQSGVYLQILKKYGLEQWSLAR